MKKYKMIEYNKIVWGHKTLYRIQALHDFGDVKAGELGGFIEKEDNLDQGGLCWVYSNAKVYGNAKVRGNAEVFDDAKVFDNAWVYDKAKVFGNAKIHENASVYGDAEVFDNASVYGDAKINTSQDYIVFKNH